MKFAIALALLLGATSGPAEAATTPRLERYSIAGTEYTRLDQWARANAFQWKWLSKNDAELWNNAARLHFTIDSKRMTLNGITVSLSEIVRNQNGVPHIAAVDVRTAIQPILFPPKNRPRTSTKNICIDPGHGGRDIGEHAGSENEKKYTLLLAQELGAQLRKAGYSVSLTRTDDTYVEVGERPRIASRRGSDLFLCLHFNSLPPGPGSSEVKGAEVYCMTPQGASSFNAHGEGKTSSAYVGNLNNARNMVLAYELQKSIVRGAKSEDRGVKRARYLVLKDAEMPAVLIEGGFMTNPGEARNIYSAAWRKQFAQAIVTGIASYRKIVEP